MADIQTLKAQYSAEILEDPNVSSVGIGLNDDGEKVMVIGVKDASVQIQVPSALSEDDYETQEIGDISPEVVGVQVAPQQGHQSRHRPVPGGVSVGHVDITAGTASFLLTNGSQVFTGSNNHVYANINQASQGDTIIQPGSSDGGSSSDQSARLEDYVPVEDGAKLDFAWARQEVEHISDLFEYTVPTGEPRRVEAGDVLKKSGRTTGVTEGQVNQVEATVNVNYGGDLGTVQFDDQIITEDMSEPGDSGSAALIKGEEVPGGVLFAGSDTATVFNQAVNVESITGLQIVTEEGDQLPTANVSLTLTAETPDQGNVKVGVSDQSGNPLQARVMLSGPVSREKDTDSSGQVIFSEVPIGDYNIAASANGYVGDDVSITSSDFN